MPIRLSSNRLDLGSANLTNAEMRGWSETVNALGSVTGATTVDLSLGNVVTATTTGATVWTVTNPSSTQTSSFTLILSNGGSQTQTWMSGTQWSNGTTPTLNSSGTDVLTFFSTDAGATWRGAKGGPTSPDQTGQKLFVWGWNTAGQLGLGDTFKRSSPVQLAGQWSQVVLGNRHTLAVKSGSTLWGWGGNSGGQLGNGDTINRSSPVQIAGTWLMLAGGFGGVGDSMGIKADGSLWSWGYNQFGCLGLGNTLSRSSPVQIPGTWKFITNFNRGAAAQRSDGTMWVWGHNTEGQLGLGDIVNRSSPVQIAGNWQSVLRSSSSGNSPSLSLRTDGTFWSWGPNANGQLGQSSTIGRSSPVQIGSGLWRSTMAGSLRGFAIASNGTLWSWGDNGSGNLGLGDTVHRSSPVQIGSGLWSKVTSGYGYNFALTPQGQIFAWGYNRHTFGSLGLGDTFNRSSPTQVVGTWTDVLAGDAHTFGFKS